MNFIGDLVGEIVGQCSTKLQFKAGKARIYLETMLLNKAKILPGMFYKMDVSAEENSVTIYPSKEGNKVTYRETKSGEFKSVIDKSDDTLKEALELCDNITVTFLVDEKGDGRVVIKGEKNTKNIKTEELKKTDKKPLKVIHFCMGSGISAAAMEKAGFEGVAGVEIDETFADIAAKNHPDTIMFNIGMEELKANVLPQAEVWCATLDCTDYSKLASTKKEEQFHTMHLFIHLMRLFYETDKKNRPTAIMIENVPEFFKYSGRSIRLCLEEQGYFVNTAILNSLDFEGRTKRERFFLVASIFEGFEFPIPTGRCTSPISADGIITVDSLEWVTPETNKTLKYYVDRNDSISHNHKITSFDINVASHIGTITKRFIGKAENLIKHPTLPNTYAFLKNIEHLRYLHGIPSNLYLGNSMTTQIASIGQSVDFNLFYLLSKKLYDFLSTNLFAKVDYFAKMEEESQAKFKFVGNQLSFDF